MRAISPLVNVTRLHNAAAAAAYMRRITALAQVGWHSARSSCGLGHAQYGGKGCGRPAQVASLPSGLLHPASQDYARRRRAFGALLIEQPLAQRALAWLQLHTAGSLAITLEVARLLGERSSRMPLPAPCC